MKCCMLYHAVFATLVSLVALASAQEPAAETKPAETENSLAALEERYRQMAEQLQQDLPKRDLKVQSVAVQKTRLVQIDPKVLENKFVAKFELVTSEPADDKVPNFFYPDSSAVLAIQKVKDPIGVQLKAFVERCHAEHRPDERMIDFLTSDDCDRAVRYAAMARGPYRVTLSFQVFAPTADFAEQRARAIVRLYDGGFSRPLQRSLLSEGQKAMELLRSQNAEMEQLSVAVHAEDEKLAKPSEISDDILSELRAQKVMVAVELAGLSARVKACDAMLGDPKKLEISTLQSVSDMKVKAEIERVGIKEKLDQINIFISEGDLRATSRSRRIELLNKLERLKRAIQATERRATWSAELFALYAAFQIPDNQIAVGPIEWTQQ